MADLMGADDTERSRGQIILVTGFALAVAFVGLALVLNSVIYTENLATRSEAAKASDAAKVHIDMVNGTERIISYTNTNNNSSYARLHANATASMDSMGELTTQLQATSAQAVSVELVEYYNGTRIEQTNNTRNFTAADSSNSEDWEVVSDIGDVDTIELGITEMKTDDAMPGDGGSPFELVASDSSGSTWTMRINNDETPGSPTDTIEPPTDDDNTHLLTITTPDGEVMNQNIPNASVINVTNGSINGDPYPNLNFGEGIGPVTSIEYRNGQNILKGNYTVFVQNETDGNEDIATSDFADTTDGPFFERLIYNATVNIEYEEGRMTYATNVTRGPGT